MNATLRRLLARVAMTPFGCWEFTGSRSPSGYGRAWMAGRVWRAHRLSYTLLVGDIPDGLEIDHLCKNKACCNPDHLEPVTRSVNIRRGSQGQVAARRQVTKTHCREGHPYDEANTYRNPEGKRQCRICRRTSDAAFTARNPTRHAEKARRRRQRLKEAAA